MTCLRWTSAPLAVVALMAGVALAERPPEQRKDADVVVRGELVKIAPKEEKIGGKQDGVLATYQADLKVTSVEKGAGIKAGDTLKISWIHITKKPTGNFVGAFGHDYKVKKGDHVEVHLMKREGDTFEVIYNQAGMEEAKK
jgi:hypothetical protein